MNWLMVADFALDSFLLLVGINLLFTGSGQFDAIMGSVITGCSLLNLHLDRKRHSRRVK